MSRNYVEPEILRIYTEIEITPVVAFFLACLDLVLENRSCL